MMPILWHSLWNILLLEVDESGDCVTVLLLLVMIRGNQWCYWKTPITLTTVIYWPSNVSLEIGGDDNYYKISDDANNNDNNNDHNDHNDKSDKGSHH